MGAKKYKDYLLKKKADVRPLTTKVDGKLLDAFQSVRKKKKHKLKDVLEASMMMYIEENKD